MFFFWSVRHAGSLFPDQGLNLCPLQWKYGVLPTGPSGNSLFVSLFYLLKDSTLELVLSVPSAVAGVWLVGSTEQCSCLDAGREQGMRPHGLAQPYCIPEMG